MECDRICIYRIYRSFGIVIEQRARTINFRSTNLLTHARTHILAYPFVHRYVANIYTLIWKKTKILIFLIFFIFEIIRFFNIFSIFFYFFFFFDESYISRTFTFDLITIEILSRATFDFTIRVRQFPSVLLLSLRSSRYRNSPPPFLSLPDSRWQINKGEKNKSNEFGLYRMKSFQITKNGHFNSFITTTVNPMSRIVFFRFAKCIQRISVFYF